MYFAPKYGPNRHFQLKVVSLLVSMCVGGCMQCPDRCIMAPLGAVQVGGPGSFSRTSLVQARLVRLTQQRRAKSARRVLQLSKGGQVAHLQSQGWQDTPAGRSWHHAPLDRNKKKGPGVYFMPKYGPNRHFQLKVVSWLVSMCVGGACSAWNDAS